MSPHFFWGDQSWCKLYGNFWAILPKQCMKFGLVLPFLFGGEENTSFFPRFRGKVSQILTFRMWGFNGGLCFDVTCCLAFLEAWVWVMFKGRMAWTDFPSTNRVFWSTHGRFLRNLCPQKCPALRIHLDPAKKRGLTLFLAGVLGSQKTTRHLRSHDS